MKNNRLFNPGLGIIFFFLILAALSCKKDLIPGNFRYYEVGIHGTAIDWRDTSFIVATADTVLISQLQMQLSLPVHQRKILTGELVSGSGGYNRNASHVFKWHFKEDNWQLTDLSAEIYDGRPYSDVDIDPGYWLNTMKRFAPWGSYIKKEISKP
jgi:hypothetical protein